MNIETLNKVISNLATGVYDSVFIKDLNKARNFNYSLVFNSNTSWTLNIEYREENIVNKRTLERQQDALIYRAVNSPMATTPFVLQNFYTKSEVDREFSFKIDKEVGKGLSSNDYTTAEKQEVAKISNKVDKLAGKELSTNDFTNELKTKLDGLSNYNDSAIRNSINTKVDKVIGKQLSTEDYTTAEKTKLAGLNNYDDSTLRTIIDSKATKIDVYTKSEVDAKFATLEALNSLIARVSALEAKP